MSRSERRGDLANFDIEEFRQPCITLWPVTIGGAEFLEQHGGHADRQARIDRPGTYAVGASTASLQNTGHSGPVFRWTSPGAVSFDPVESRPNGA